MSMIPFKEFIATITSQLHYDGISVQDAALFSLDFHNMVVEALNCKSEDIEVHPEEEFTGSYDDLTKVAIIQGRDYSIPEETLDYLLIEADNVGNIWISSYDLQRSDLTLIKRNK